MSDVETPEELPHCETPLQDGGAIVCGEQRGLKRVIYDRHPASPDPKESIVCDRHFNKAWSDPAAESAESIKTAKD